MWTTKSYTCKQKRQKKQLTRTVFEELKNQANMGTLKFSFAEEGNEGQREVLCDIRLMMKDMRNGCLAERLGLTCSAEYLGDDVRVIEWKKKEEKLKRQDREDEPNDGSDGEYRGFQKTHLSAGTKLVSMTSVVLARTWRTHAVALAANEKYNIRSKIATAAGKRKPASVALFPEMEDMEVENMC